MTRINWDAETLLLDEIVMPLIGNESYILEDTEYLKVFYELVTDRNFNILDLLYLDNNDIVGDKLYDIWLESNKDKSTFINNLDNLRIKNKNL